MELDWSKELLVVVDESHDVARKLGHSPTSAHVLLCLFTAKNQAAIFLAERNITGDRLLEGVRSRLDEKPDTWERILRRAQEVATVNESDRIGSLHVLVALCSFVDSAAYRLMKGLNIDIAAVRNAALAWLQRNSIPTGPGHERVPAPQRESAPDNSPPRSTGSEQARRASEPVAGRASAPSLPDPRTSPSARTAVEPASSKQPPLRNLTPPAEQEERPRTARGPRPPDDVRKATEPAPTPPASAAPKPTVTNDLRARLLAQSTIAPPQAPAQREVLKAPAPIQVRPLPVQHRPTAAGHDNKATAALRPLFTLREQEFPLLAKLGRNLTLLALEDKIDRVVGREAEIDQLVDILNRRRSNNPVLIGDAGVGKTAVVEGLAHRIVGHGETPPPTGMDRKILVEVEASRMVSGTGMRGSFAERIQALKKEVAKAEGRIIVFLDELHHWIGMGAGGDGPADGAGELKTALARGEFPCVGATTWEEYRKYVETDPAFERRFQVVRVNEPSPEAAIGIVRGVIPQYASHHLVDFDDDAVDAAVRLSHRYLPDRRLPDKAIGIIDMAGSRARRLGSALVDRALVATVVAEQAGLSADKLLMADRERFLHLEDRLMQRIIGQQHAVERVAAVLRRNYAGFVNHRPIGSFLFLGSTGVGKTEFARAIASVLFHDENSMTRIDMTEFMEAHSVARLIGAPPGYVGHDAGGQLTEAVRRRPYQLILLDEVEKAHPDVLNLLIQLLEDGRLTDSRGRTVDFTNAVVVLTSNLGAEQALKKQQRAVGFGTSQAAQTPLDVHASVTAEARRHFRPELWNRIDEVLAFDSLSREEVARIARLQLTRSSERLLRERGIQFVCGLDVVEWLIESGGYEHSLGARPMRRTIERLIEARIADEIVAGRVQAPATLELYIEDGLLRLRALELVQVTTER
jgi:ATP-dependent Clp protease ATP-binding subunit ClpC